jgi:4-carboxymuconolactone decarboxylase
MNAANAFLGIFESLDHSVRAEGPVARLEMDRPIRAMLCLAMVAGKIQTEQVPAHVRECVQAGLGRTEVGEVLMHVYCYAGVYSSLASFQAASSTFLELEKEGRLTAEQNTVANQPPPSVTCDERMEHGLNIRRALFGEEEIDGILARADAFDTLFNDLTHDFCFGNIWARPTFDRQMRSQLCLAIASATGQLGAVGRHTKSAVIGGVSLRRIAEIFMLAYVYGGVYNAQASFAAAQSIFEEMAVDTSSLG